MWSIIHNLDDDWVQPSHQEPLKMPNRKPIQRTFSKPPTHSEPNQDHVEPTPAYLYPFTKDREIMPATAHIAHKRLSYSSSFENKEVLHRSASHEEQKIKPTMIRPRNYEAPFKHILDERQYADDFEQNDEHNVEDEPEIVAGKYLQAKERLERKYRRSAGVKESKYYDDEEQQQPIHSATPDYRYPPEKGVRKSIEPIRSAAKDIAHFSDRNDEPASFDYRENLTDKQKYREALIDKQERLKGRMRERSVEDRDDFYDHKYNDRHGYREEPLGKPRMLPPAKTRYERSPEKAAYKPEPPINDHTAYRPRKHESNYIKERPETLDFENPLLRNPYKEPDSLPYRESIEKMIKSPVMRYKSFDDTSYSDDESNDDKGGQLSKYLEHHHESTTNKHRRSYKEPLSQSAKFEHSSRSPMMSAHRYDDKKHTSYHSSDGASISKVSPKDRFQDAKQKFQAMELDRNSPHEKQGYSQQRRPVQHRQSSYDRKQQHHDWSFEESSPPPQLPPLPPVSSHKRMQQLHQQHSSEYHHDVPTQTNTSTPVQSSDRYMDKHESHHQSRALGPAKSLGNLVKGYRHSYAEPHNTPMPRNSGRVGLAAVNPF